MYKFEKLIHSTITRKNKETGSDIFESKLTIDLKLQIIYRFWFLLYLTFCKYFDFEINESIISINQLKFVQYWILWLVITSSSKNSKQNCDMIQNFILVINNLLKRHANFLIYI